MTKCHAQFNQFVCPSASDVLISLRYGTNAHSSVDTLQTHGTPCALTACLSSGHIARLPDFKTMAKGQRSTDPVTYRNMANFTRSTKYTQLTDSNIQNTQVSSATTGSVSDSSSLMH